MPIHQLRASRLIFAIMLAAISLSCALLPRGSLSGTGASQEASGDVTATPAQGFFSPDSLPEAATPDVPGQDEIELRFLYPLSQQECIAHFPFEEVPGGNPRTIAGKGILDCHFEVEQCGDGVCLIHHSIFYMDGDLSGVIHTSSTSYPDGGLEAALAVTFTLTQYWTDIPPGAFVAFTESNPAVFGGTDIIPLFFRYEDGASQEVMNTTVADAQPWVFTLRLQ